MVFVGLKGTRNVLIRRKARKSKAPRRRWYRKGMRKPSKGFICVKRKHPEIYVRNSAVAGVAQLNDPTGTCVTLGAPIADAVGGTYSIPFSMTFRLDQVINSTDITNLCDAYKLKYVRVGVTYQSTQASVGSLGIMPNITWIQDHDDAGVPASINALREKMGAKFRTFGFNKIVHIGIQPRVADTTFNNGVTSAYAVAKQMWMNTTYAGAEHYAIKGILSNVNLAATASTLTAFKFDITTTVYGKDFQ